MDSIKNAAKLADKNTLVFERTFSVAPGKLWEALATKEGLSRWFMPTKFEIEEGGRFSFEGGWEGTISEVQPTRYITFTPDETETAFLRFEISETRDGCLFKLIDRMEPDQDAAKLLPDTTNDQNYQPGGPGTHWSGIIAGYHGFVDTLDSYLTGNNLDFDYGDLCKKYKTLQDEWYDS